MTEKADTKRSVLVLDDHPMVRDGLTRLISQASDLLCCGAVATAAEARILLSQLTPDLLILDLRLKDADGSELIGSLKSVQPNLKILVVSQTEETPSVENALRKGAHGYVSKDHAPREILAAIRAILNGQIYLKRGLAVRLLGRVAIDSLAESSNIRVLTDRELHILQLLGLGLNTQQIADELQLSVKTIQAHRENMKRKLGLPGAELIRRAKEWAHEHISLRPDELPATSSRNEA